MIDIYMSDILKIVVKCMPLYSLKKILSIFTDSDVMNVTTSDVLKELFGDLEDNHDIFHASCEARSHLNYLISKQQLVKSVNDEGVEIYNRNIS